MMSTMMMRWGKMRMTNDLSNLKDFDMYFHTDTEPFRGDMSLTLQLPVVYACGVISAIVFDVIVRGEQRNRLREDKWYYREDCYWFRCTYHDLWRIMPFVSEYTIQHAVKSLEKKQLLISKRFGDEIMGAFDRTKWYHYDRVGLMAVRNEFYDTLQYDGRCGNQTGEDSNEITF